MKSSNFGWKKKIFVSSWYYIFWLVVYLMLSSQVPTLAHVNYDCHTELTTPDYLEKYLIIVVKYLTAAVQNYFWSEHNNEIFTSIRCTSIVTGELETPVQLDFLRFRTILMSDLEMLKCIFHHQNQESHLCFLHLRIQGLLHL